MSIPAIDFKGLGVTAITRRGSELCQTIVLYRNSAVDEGCLYFKCSNEEHDVLALEFKKYLEQKGGVK